MEVPPDLQVDKVVAMRRIQATPNKTLRKAQLLLLQGKHAAAEDALISQHLHWAIVDLNLRQFKWQRALTFAEQADDDRIVQLTLWHRSVAVRCQPEIDLPLTCLHDGGAGADWLSGCVHCRARHLQLLGRDPLQAGKDDEHLPRYEQLFREKGIPKHQDVAHLARELEQEQEISIGNAGG